MFSLRSGGWLAALFFSLALPGGCSSKTYTDMNFGTDAGAGFVPEVSDASLDAEGGEAGDMPLAADAATPADTAADGDSATLPDTDPVDAGDESADAAADNLDNG